MFHQLWNKSGIEFAAYVPFYPDCATTFAGDTETADRPIRIFGGTADDYNPIALCKAYAERLTAAGNRASYVCFDRQIHGFVTMGGVLAAAQHGLARCAQFLRVAFANVPR